MKQMNKKKLENQQVLHECPILFDDVNAVAIISTRYVGMIENFVIPEHQQLGIDFQIIWFKQDGTAVISQRGDNCLTVAWQN